MHADVAAPRARARNVIFGPGQVGGFALKRDKRRCSRFASRGRVGTGEAPRARVAPGGEGSRVRRSRLNSFLTYRSRPVSPESPVKAAYFRVNQAVWLCPFRVKAKHRLANAGRYGVCGPAHQTEQLAGGIAL